MHGPMPATMLCQPQGLYPGVCEMQGPCGSSYGFFVPYRREKLVNGSLERCEAIINLVVSDSPPDAESVTSPCVIPFVIDTGADVTIIPRELVPNQAFPIEGSIDPYAIPIEGVTGATVTGHVFSASLSLALPSAVYGVLRFGLLEVVVVDIWEGHYAVLGMDALGRVIVISDSDSLSLWPA